MIRDTETALDALREELRQLRLLRGQPSLRSISDKIGWSHATVGRAFSCETTPRWDVVDAIAVHLDGDKDNLRRLWMACMGSAQQADDGSEAGARAPRDKFPAVITGVAMSVFLVFVGVLVLFLPNKPSTNKTVTDIVLLVLGCAASLAWYFVFFKRRDWRSLALCFGLMGWVEWRVHCFGAGPPEESFAPPALSDFVYLLLPIFVIPGFSLALSRRMRWRYFSAVPLVAAWVFAALVALTVGGLTRLSVSGVFVYALLISTDLVMLILVVWSATLERTWELRIASSGFGVLLFADSVSVGAPVLPPPSPAPFVAALGFLAFVLFLMVSARSALGTPRS